MWAQKLWDVGFSYWISNNCHKMHDNVVCRLCQKKARWFSCDNQHVDMKVNLWIVIDQVRNLKWLNFRVPLAIVNKAHQANQLYPFAISLIESVRSYERTSEKIDEKGSLNLLVAGMRRDIQGLIAEVGIYCPHCYLILKQTLNAPIFYCSKMACSCIIFIFYISFSGEFSDTSTSEHWY